MISAVSVENFLIHRNRKFTLTPGVTLLTGENGRGKTAQPAHRVPLTAEPFSSDTRPNKLDLLDRLI